ncbi:PUA-like domain-containing protein [Hygrophoropsis aurantiaca]|uniref:PUA-like domain-containing protein n=1 Tax=Hygrophoropsis aurantiaca TaxID=72124 RepID=A0ACB8AHC1_9AGAM|nr:PUA-like domain-containing protein [Hygrophoropsis aurantiaca]
MSETQLSVMSDETLVPDTPPNPTDHDEVSIGTKKRKRASKPKVPVFGEIPGVEIGASWKKRDECAAAGVHRTNSAGIQGSGHRGCYSIAISNVYKDDRDFGEIIIYTGEGGRQKADHVNGKRIYNQTWSIRGNLSLLVSLKTGKPVRVVRSFKVVSKYAPAEGYRYDGLYVVKDVIDIVSHLPRLFEVHLDEGEND